MRKATKILGTKFSRITIGLLFLLKCMATLSTHMANLSPPPFPKSAFKENVMIFDPQTGNACIIGSQGELEFADFPWFTHARESSSSS